MTTLENVIAISNPDVYNILANLEEGECTEVSVPHSSKYTVSSIMISILKQMKYFYPGFNYNVCAGLENPTIIRIIKLSSKSDNLET